MLRPFGLAITYDERCLLISGETLTLAGHEDLYALIVERMRPTLLPNLRRL